MTDSGLRVHLHLDGAERLASDMEALRELLPFAAKLSKAAQEVLFSGLERFERGDGLVVTHDFDVAADGVTHLFCRLHLSEGFRQLAAAARAGELDAL